MANKTIYDLTENQSLDENDLFEQDVYQDSQRKSLKTTLRAIADKIATSLTFSSLGTTSKTLVGAINEAAQGGGGGGHNYSTTEHVVGTWIDGSTIYEKTINVGTLTTGDNAFNHGITNLNNIISANGFALRGQSTRMVIPYSSNNAGGWSIGIYEFNDTKGYVVTGTGYTGQYELSNCYVTLQYTKSS